MTVRSKTYTAYQSVPDALLIVGRDGSIVFANQHAEHLFGYEPDQLELPPRTKSIKVT